MPRLFVDNLTFIDCSVLDPVRGLIGASWAVNIELIGELDQQSMVFDFSKVKKTIKQVIDQTVDHKLLVPIQYSGFSKQDNNADQLKLTFTTTKNEVIEHHSPVDALCLINADSINTENIIAYLKKAILAELPDNVQALQIELNEEQAQGNYYRYSHGLKKHDGNCQRIAHGHRSQIQIWLNGQRSDTLEKQIAQAWHDIYLGSEEDITTQDNQRIEFTYRAEQGAFFISLPKQRVHIMPNDSTVECIAEHLLDLLADENPNADLKVKAFEGIAKGAIASSD